MRLTKHPDYPHWSGRTDSYIHKETGDRWRRPRTCKWGDLWYPTGITFVVAGYRVLLDLRRWP